MPITVIKDLSNDTKYSAVLDTRILQQWTRSDWFVVDTSAIENAIANTGGMDISGVTDNGDSMEPISVKGLRARLLTGALGVNPLFQQIGDADMDIATAFCVERQIHVDGPNCFHIQYSFMNPTLKTDWEFFDNVQVQDWNYDKDGKILNVTYTVPGGAAASPLIMPGGFTNVPHIASSPRYVWAGLWRRTRFIPWNHESFTLFDDNDLTSATINRVNTTAWPAKTGLAPRTAMVAKVTRSSPNNNSFVYKEVTDILILPYTWDQLSLYLTQDNKMLPGTDDIPKPEDFAASEKGLLGGSDKANGWIRAKMQPEVDFNDWFDPNDDLK